MCKMFLTTLWLNENERAWIIWINLKIYSSIILMNYYERKKMVRKLIEATEQIAGSISAHMMSKSMELLVIFNRLFYHKLLILIFLFSARQWVYCFSLLTLVLSSRYSFQFHRIAIKRNCWDFDEQEEKSIALKNR